jgi:serine/threonine protein kinase
MFLSKFLIIRLFDVVQTKEKMLLIFEYMDTDLNKFIQSFKSNKIPMEVVRDILKQILNGLFFLNLRDILHRDLAPKNILLNIKNGNIQVKLADFGLARKDSLRLTKEVGNYYFII